MKIVFKNNFSKTTEIYTHVSTATLQKIAYYSLKILSKSNKHYQKVANNFNLLQHKKQVLQFCNQ